MELWVRSQDRECLLKINRVDIDTNGRTIMVNGFETIIGIYKSKERALEILDEIQNILKPVIITTEYECDIKDNPRDKTHFNLEMKPEKTEIQQITSYVYKMPEE
jgi:hypothetical protein